MSPILTPIWSSCVIDWWKWETSNGMTMRSKIDVYVASRERIGHPAECIYRKPFEGNRNGKERWRRHEGLSSHWSSMIYWVISLRYLFFIDENLSFVPYARLCLWKCDYRSIEYCSRDDKKHHQICWMTSCEQNISSDKLRWRISIFFLMIECKIKMWKLNCFTKSCHKMKFIILRYCIWVKNIKISTSSLRNWKLILSLIFCIKQNLAS